MPSHHLESSAAQLPQWIPPSSKHCLQDYLPIKPLGRGAMGTVLLVLHPLSKKLFALKVMSKEVMLRRSSFRRAETEKNILAKLDHPFLPTLHSHFESDNYGFLVLDYCSGGDLNVLRQRQPEKKFSEAAVRFYAAEMVLALEHLHQLGIVYRDLKPENVLISASGHVKLTDFDLSLRMSPEKRLYQAIDVEIKKPKQTRFLFSCFGASIAPEDAAIACMALNCARSWKDHRLKCRRTSPTRVLPMEAKFGHKNSSTGLQARSFVGTEEYVAPEVLLGTGHDFAVDWWALGVLLYELLYGKTPFKGLTRKQTFYNILHKEPEFLGPWTPLQDLIGGLLVKEPGQRLGYHQGADEVKTHLFFRGAQWDSLQYVARPPFVPDPTFAGVHNVNQVSNLEDYLAAMELSRKSSMSSDEEIVESDETSPEERSSISCSDEERPPNAD